ncbi:MAG: queuosine precursor transporter [Patescibacteria group bacterium]
MPEKRAYKYFDLIVGLFVAVLVISNIASVKIVLIRIPLGLLRPILPLPPTAALTFDGGTLLFPISYIFGDILTEVYGFAHSRRAIWTGFAGLALLSLTLWIVGILPAAPGWTGQEAYKATLMFAPRVAGASMLAYFAGGFANSTILSRLKIATRGRWLWTRTIGSTLVGELVDSVVFVAAAFAGAMSSSLLFSIMLSNYVFKTAYEIAATPATYAVTGWLKRAEQEDKYDYGEKYNPFRLE